MKYLIFALFLLTILILTGVIHSCKKPIDTGMDADFPDEVLLSTLSIKFLQDKACIKEYCQHKGITVRNYYRYCMQYGGMSEEFHQYQFSKIKG